jgi:hypothetical protein
VPTPFSNPDLDTAVRAHLAAGPVPQDNSFRSLIATA